MLRLSYSNLAVLTTSLALYFQHGGWTARELLHLFLHRGLFVVCTVLLQCRLSHREVSLVPPPVASSSIAAGWLSDSSRSCPRRLVAGRRRYSIRIRRRFAFGTCLRGTSFWSGRL